KASHRKQFLATVDSRSIWTAKKLAVGKPPDRFPSIPDATTPLEINDALLLQLPRSSAPSSMSYHWTKKRSRGPYPNRPTPRLPVPIRSPMGSGRGFTASTPTFLYRSSTPSYCTASTLFLSRRPMVWSSRNLVNSTTPPPPHSE